MTAQVSANFITSFDAEVKLAYQTAGVLSGTYREKMNVNGSSHKFPKMGRGIASIRIPQTDVIPMNLGHSTAVATLENWNAADYSDIQDLEKIAFDEKQEIAKSVGMAMGRRKDQIVIDAMTSGANATVVDATAGLTTAKLLELKRVMDANGVPSSDRYLVHSARFLEQLLGLSDVKSADFNTIRALVQGDLKTWIGFEFKLIDDRDEGGLPLAATIRNGYAYHKDAVGLASGKDLGTKIDWIAEKTSWLINGMFSAGATVIDNQGVYKITTTEA